MCSWSFVAFITYGLFLLLFLKEITDKLFLIIDLFLTINSTAKKYLMSVKMDLKLNYSLTKV